MSTLQAKSEKIVDGKKRKQQNKNKENDAPIGGINGSNTDNGSEGRLISHDLIAVKGDLHYKLSSESFQSNVFVTFMEVEINDQMNINIDDRDTYWLAFAGVRVPLVWYMQLSPKLEKTANGDYIITISTKQSEADSKYIALNYKDNYAKYMKWYQLFTDAISDLLFRYGLQSISLKTFNPPLYCIWESFPMVTDANNNIICNCCHKIGIDRLNTVTYYASKLLHEDHSQLMLVKRIQSFKLRLQQLLKTIDDAVAMNQNCKEMLIPCKNLVNEVDENFKLSELLATDCDLQLLKNYYFYLQTLDSPMKQPISHTAALGSPQVNAPKTPATKAKATPGGTSKSAVKRTVQFAKSPLGLVRSTSKKTNIADNELVVYTEEIIQQPEVDSPIVSISTPHMSIASPYHIITPSPPSTENSEYKQGIHTPWSLHINNSISVEPVVNDNITSISTTDTASMTTTDTVSIANAETTSTVVVTTTVDAVSVTNADTISNANDDTISNANVDAISNANVDAISNANVDTTSTKVVTTTTADIISITTIHPTCLPTTDITSITSVHPASLPTIDTTNLPNTDTTSKTTAVAQNISASYTTSKSGNVKFITLIVSIIFICITLLSYPFYHKTSENMNNVSGSIAIKHHRTRLVTTRSNMISESTNNELATIATSDRKLVYLFAQDVEDGVEISSQDKYVAASIKKLFQRMH